jgi:hypothetical protein
VGSRSIPGRYPLPPTSRLLRNEGGQFVDVAEECAPGIAKAGLVTGALWSDADGDRWPDLVVTCEWGRCGFIEHGGRLVERTQRLASPISVAGGLPLSED